MNPNINPSERARILGAIDPDAYAANSYSTGWIEAAKFDSFMAVVMAGDLGTSATLDAKLEQAKDGSGTTPADIEGKEITQLTQAGPDSNKQAVINLRPEELDTEDGYTHFRLTITVAEATSDAGAFVLGFDAKYGPGADAESVDEIVE